MPLIDPFNADAHYEMAILYVAIGRIAIRLTQKNRLN